jgi:hypothetical protein
MKWKNLRYVLMNDEPGAAGGGEPEVTTPEPTNDEPEVSAQDSIMSALDQVGQTEPEAKEAAPVVPEKPAAEPKKPESDDEPPEDVSDRAKGRWAQLAEKARKVPELETQLEQTRQQVEGVKQLVQSAGLDADEFGAVLNIGKLYKSNDPQDLGKAKQVLESLLVDVSARLGVDVGQVDVLAQHPDLAHAVAHQQLSREHALEMVRLRSESQRLSGTNQRLQQATQEQVRSQQEAQQFHQTVQQAAADMDSHLAARAGEPGHAAKMGYVQQYFKDPQRMQAFVSTYQPQQWKAAVTMLYDSYNPPAPRQNVPQPLRPTNTVSGARVNNSPTSAEAAIMGAFEQFGL